MGNRRTVPDVAVELENFVNDRDPSERDYDKYERRIYAVGRALTGRTLNKKVVGGHESMRKDLIDGKITLKDLGNMTLSRLNDIGGIHEM